MEVTSWEYFGVNGLWQEQSQYCRFCALVCFPFRRATLIPCGFCHQLPVMNPIRSIFALPGSRDPKNRKLVCDETGSAITFNSGVDVLSQLARITLFIACTVVVHPVSRRFLPVSPSHERRRSSPNRGRHRSRRLRAASRWILPYSCQLNPKLWKCLAFGHSAPHAPI